MRSRKWVAPLVAYAALTAQAHAEPLTFADALARAQEGAPSLKARALEVGAARSMARSAGALPDPRLEAGVEGFPVSGPLAGRPGGDDFSDVRLGLAQDVPNAAKRRARVERARADVGSAEAQVALTARQVRVGAALAWSDLYFAQKKLAALGEVETLVRSLLDTAPSRVASGAARPAEALEPPRMLAELADRRSALQADVGRARAELTRWTGDPAPEPAGSAPAFAVDPVALRAGLDRLPTLRAVDAAAGQAEADVALARAEKRPDWGWQVAYQHRNPMFGDMVSASVTVSLPLFGAGRQDPVIAARLLDANRVALEREAARRDLVAALDGDLADHAMHHERLMRAQTALVPLARQRVDLEVASYGAGTIGLGEVLLAVTAYGEARFDIIDREAAVERDAVRLVLTYGSDDQ
jgi:cobalt-zinc-cadmium efflux system outer membrane protein